MNNGTINVVNGSKVVSGVGTAFLTSANPARVGQPMIIADSIYEIEKVVSDTSILLATNYRGATENGVAYSVVTTAEGSSTDLARRAAQVMGYYQGQLDTLNALMAGTGNVTATLPDGTVVTLPAWSELKKIENIKPGTMQGPMSAANMKSAIKIDNQTSISFQDQGGTMFHFLAAGNTLKLASGLNATNGIIDISTLNIQAVVPIYSDGALITRSSNRTTWLGLECPSGAEPYISSKGINDSSTVVAMRFGAAQVEVEKAIEFKKYTNSSFNANRSWSSYGSANYTCSQLTATPGVLHGALSYPFGISGGYSLDMFIGSYAETPSVGGLYHVFGFTNGAAFNPTWRMSAGGNMAFHVDAVNGTIGTMASLSPITAPSLTPTSDGRLKPEKLRKKIGEVSSKLRLLNPMWYFKQYSLGDIGQGEFEFGHIADEVKLIEPRLVKEVGPEKIKCLSTDGITAHLVKGWQEHDEIISQLQLLNLPERLKVIERQLGILDADGMRQP
ncbi:hypothetical protein [Aeromonas salmonicida]|uniref:hypothetical protein n=1 Tax=Aeromonas salmonicida TaxID=645 RepID=UPI0030D3F3EF